VGLLQDQVTWVIHRGPFSGRQGEGATLTGNGKHDNGEQGRSEGGEESSRRKFEQEIPGLMAEVGEALVATAGQGDRTAIATLEEAQRIAHSLAGTAGTLGLGDVGSVARAVAVALKDLQRTRRVEASSSPAGSPDEGRAESRGRAVIASVLVVDADTDFLESTKAMGSENLIRVHCARTGAEALDVAGDHHLDGAFVDVGLGAGEDAFKVARDLRSLSGLAALPIAFLSAEATLPNRIAATHAGGSLFLGKPLDADEFVDAVRHLAPLDRERMQRVLVVDDDETFLSSIAEILTAERMKVETLSDPLRILERIDDVRPDLLLLDVVMPQVSGFEVCRVLRSTEQWRDLPILFLTVHGGEDARIACFDAGGDDYIEKPLIRRELLARINTRLERVRLHRERADRDPLTGLPTRRAFVEQFKMRLAEAHRHKKPVSLCLIDLDRFKQINDTYGHLAGDRVLGGFGRLLASRFRTMDVRGRWGGEEFVLAFYGEDGETTKMIVGRVRDELSRMEFRGDHGELFEITFSAGISSFPDDGRTFEELFRAVDRRVNSAKERGRNRIEI
jgi:diguanylate cyclase (GGDEF)-like protein